MPRYLVEYYSYIYLDAENEDTALETGVRKITSGESDGSS